MTPQAVTVGSPKISLRWAETLRSVTIVFLGMGGHGYSGQNDGGPGFHSGHFVHMRGLPFRATEGDVAKVSNASVNGLKKPLCFEKHSLCFNVPIFFFLVLLSVKSTPSPHWFRPQWQVDWRSRRRVPLTWRCSGSHVQRQESHAYVPGFL